MTEYYKFERCWKCHKEWFYPDWRNAPAKCPSCGRTWEAAYEAWEQEILEEYKTEEYDDLAKGFKQVIYNPETKEIKIKKR